MGYHTTPSQRPAQSAYPSSLGELAEIVELSAADNSRYDNGRNPNVEVGGNVLNSYHTSEYSLYDIGFILEQATLSAGKGTSRTVKLRRNECKYERGERGYENDLEAVKDQLENLQFTLQNERGLASLIKDNVLIVRSKHAPVEPASPTAPAEQ